MPSISGWASGEPVPSSDINTYLLRGSRNALINGDFRINQRGSGTYADDTYFADRWTALADGMSMDAGTVTSNPPTDGLWSGYLRPLTNSKKFGMVQFVEQLNCVGMFGQMVTLSFKAKVTSATNISNVKAGILSWSGTADTLTSDVVSSWGASGTTPTLAASWTFENTPSNLGVTSSWVTYRVQGVIDTASVKNVAAFIWVDSTTATTSDYLYVTDVQLEIGAIATPFERRSVAEELTRCFRYYKRFTGSGNAYQNISPLGVSDAANNVFVSWPQDPPLRTSAVLEYSTLRVASALLGYSLSTLSIWNAAPTNITLQAAASVTLPTSTPMWVQGNNSTSAYIAFNCEM